MSSSQAQPAPRTGAHRAHGRTLPDGEHPPASPHEPYLDGLFTYCLSVLCDHDAAVAVLAEVLAVAERHPGRCPGEGDRRAWLYALARWACLRRLSEQRRVRHSRQGRRGRRGRPASLGGAHTGGRAPERRGRTPAYGPPAAAESALPPQAAAGAEPRPDPAEAARQRAELARLAWPEAAGTTPEQREALELAVRHRLAVPELAAVLGTAPAAARELLSGAACEVERTRAALAVVDTGCCPSVARLTGDSQVLLSTTLRAELVRHVDDCPRCRRVAERVGAGAPWPGSGSTNTAALPLVPAPRGAVHAAVLGAARSGRAAGPRFTRTGFPMDPKDRAARRDRIRARAVTTTVVATVVAAPVLALWAAYRGAPHTGEPTAGGGATRISASEAEIPLRSDGRPHTGYENAGNVGNAARAGAAPGFPAGSRTPDVSVEVISTGAPSTPTPAGPDSPGRIVVDAVSRGATTYLRLSASGGAPVDWRLWSDAPWLRVSQASGTLSPGESVTLVITVDRDAQPAGAWRARVGVDPGDAVIAIQGRGRPATTPGQPTPAPEPTPTPTQTPEPTPTPTPTPTTPEPTTTPPPTSTPEPSPQPPEGTVSPSPEPSPSPG
ncbi:hypothetical protein [Streptomyces sp. NPDC051211]|uniref:BACON domain-containing protein n=1 Tax=Streptomyces sp. NPDC051211 TaxID=3154643 RepID=UPI00344DAC61